MHHKSKSLVFIILFILSTIFAGCAGSGQDVTLEEQKQGEKKDRVIERGEKLVIYTSMYPLYNFTKKIVGNQAEVINLVPAGAEPHDFEPTAKDIMKLSKANLFIYNGAGFESWLNRVIEATNNPDLVIVDTTKQMNLLTNDEIGHEHYEDEMHGDEATYDEQEKNNHEEAHDHHRHGEFDPHVWVDPSLAKQQAEAIKAALVAVDQENSEFYEDNFAQLAVQFDDLDGKYKEVTEQIKRRDFVVSHAAFGYLALRYDLNQVAIAGLNLEEPSTKELQDIIKFVKDNKIEYILFENNVTPKVAEVVQEEVGAQALILHNLEGLTEEELSQGKDYFSIMEENLEVLKLALGYKQ